MGLKIVSIVLRIHATPMIQNGARMSRTGS